VDDIWATNSEGVGVGLMARAVSFQEFPHGPDPPTLQTDRRTDVMQSQYRAMHYSASRGKMVKVL